MWRKENLIILVSAIWRRSGGATHFYFTCCLCFLFIDSNFLNHTLWILSPNSQHCSQTWSIENGSFQRKRLPFPASLRVQQKRVRFKQSRNELLTQKEKKKQWSHFFIPFLLSCLLPSSTSSSLAFEISFLSNTNFKRRLSSSGSQINFIPHCNMKTNAYTYTQVPVNTHTHTDTALCVSHTNAKNCIAAL